ncbi:hypothetical protein [Duganella sp. S19_KUP01_CR8]|uniref:hypothetical protein n=1 Tax=Duganella sp. S19_KUP01_CR8 TaxID=3025502 RepID=UPI002FCD7E01
MDFAELAFRRIDEHRLKVDAYVDWANELLEGGCDVPSIWELAAYRWDAYIDPDQVERLFLSCVGDLGLELPSDWYVALCAYSSILCERMLHGITQPWDCLIEMLTIADDHNEPYIHWVWIDLSRDFEPIERRRPDYICFNGRLDLKKSDDCIRTVAQQFIALCTLPLPEKFPWVWQCQECGAVGEESTFTDTKACTCTKCGTAFAMKNMRFFEHRDELVRRSATK